MDYEKQYHEYLARVNRALEAACNTYLPEESEVCRAARYSLMSGGKRIRAVLVLSVCDMLHGNAEAAEQFAAAVEMLHCYSLIHDDLPCMDNDDMRRGKPSNHKVYGEDIALLAGDALQSLAFEIMTSDKAISQSSAAACCKAVNTLAAYCGARGMVGGQVIDLINENKSAPIEVLREMDYKKTACLIKAACELGCISANADDKLIKSASEYGECIGIAFQIQDDILDVTSTDEELGKPVGSDNENAKSTYVSLLGIEKCRELVAELTDKAKTALNAFDGDTTALCDFTDYLASRKK